MFVPRFFLPLVAVTSLLTVLLVTGAYAADVSGSSFGRIGQGAGAYGPYIGALRSGAARWMPCPDDRHDQCLIEILDASSSVPAVSDALVQRAPANPFSGVVHPAPPAFGSLPGAPQLPAYPIR